MIACLGYISKVVLPDFLMVTEPGGSLTDKEKNWATCAHLFAFFVFSFNLHMAAYAHTDSIKLPTQ